MEFVSLVQPADVPKYRLFFLSLLFAQTMALIFITRLVIGRIRNNQDVRDLLFFDEFYKHRYGLLLFATAVLCFLAFPLKDYLFLSSAIESASRNAEFMNSYSFLVFRYGINTFMISGCWTVFIIYFSASACGFFARKSEISASQ